MTAETGTYRWMAPEIIRHEPYTKACDVYSYGMVLFEMLCRTQPFDGLTPVQAAYAVAKENLRPPLPVSTPNNLKAIVNQCWSQDPKNRPSFEEIIRLLDRVKATVTTK